MNVPSARASRASVARQYCSAALAVIFKPALVACPIALFLHSSKLTYPKKQSYPLARSKVNALIFRLDGLRVNRLSARVIIVLSLLTLLTVLSGYTHPPQLTEPDESAAEHVFLLSIVAAAFSILVFLGTADWKQPLRSVRPLAFPTAASVLAFGAL